MAKQFKAALESALSSLPITTLKGCVVAQKVDAYFGYPGGTHEVGQHWVYSRRDSDLEMIFSFFENFNEDDLLCKVVSKGDYPQNGGGATIQFNSDRCMVDAPVPFLRHNGIVTVRHPLSREALLKLMDAVCPDVVSGLGLAASDWPFIIGSTDDIAALLDTLFEYAYCVEQAKRKQREEGPLTAILT